MYRNNQQQTTTRNVTGLHVDAGPCARPQIISSEELEESDIERGGSSGKYGCSNP